MKKNFYIAIFTEKEEGFDAIITNYNPLPKCRPFYKSKVGPFATMIAAVRKAKKIGLKI